MRVLKEIGIEISLEVIGLEKIEQKIFEINAHLERAKELAAEIENMTIEVRTYKG